MTEEWNRVVLHAIERGVDEYQNHNAHVLTCFWSEVTQLGMDYSIASGQIGKLVAGVGINKESNWAPLLS